MNDRLLNSTDQDIQDFFMRVLNLSSSGSSSFDKKLQVVSSGKQIMQVFSIYGLVERWFFECRALEEKRSWAFDDKWNQVSIE